MATKGTKKATASKAKKAAKSVASKKASTAKRTKKAALPTKKAAPSSTKSTKRSAARPKTTVARTPLPRSTTKAAKGKQVTPNPTNPPKKTTKVDAKKAPAAKTTGAKASASQAVEESATKVSASRVRAAASSTKKSGNRAAAPPVAESPAALRAKKRARQRLMQKFRRILLDKQASLLEAYHIAKGDSQTSTSDGTEDYIDYAVSSYAREFSLSLSEMERKNLRLVEEALARLDRKNFGDCQQCGNEIPIPRLDVEPWARHCIRCQELEEQGLLEERDSEWDDEEAVSSEAEARLAGEGDEESDEEEREDSN